MRKQWLKINLNYLAWSITFVLFLVFMTNQYCEMVYGMGVFQVIFGKNKITEDEKTYLKQQTRGGMNSMLGTASLILCAISYGGILEATGVLKVLVAKVLNYCKENMSKKMKHLSYQQYSLVLS